MVDVAQIEQWSPIRLSRPHGSIEALAPWTCVDITIRLAAMDRREPMWRNRKNVADLVVALHERRDRRKFRRAAVVESIGIDGEQQANPVERAHRHWSGYDRGDVAVEHGDAGGGRMAIDASLEPSLELVERHGGRRHCWRNPMATSAHAAACPACWCATFQSQARGSGT